MDKEHQKTGCAPYISDRKTCFLSRMDEEATKLTMCEFSLSDAVLDTAEPFKAVAQTKDKSWRSTWMKEYRMSGMKNHKGGFYIDSSR